MLTVATHFHLKGNCDEVYNILLSFGITVDKNRIANDFDNYEDFIKYCLEQSEGQVEITIFDNHHDFDEENIDEQLNNDGCVCLIGFQENKANLIEQKYGKYTLNFSDAETCASFLMGYYYSLEADKFGDYLLYDICAHIGYGFSKDKNNIIKSSKLPIWNYGKQALPRLIFAFSRDPKFKTCIDEFVEMLLQKNHNNLLLIKDEIVDAEFFRIFYIEENTEIS